MTMKGDETYYGGPLSSAYHGQTEEEIRLANIARNGNDGLHYLDEATAIAQDTGQYDAVLNPSHYDLIPEKNVQVIDVIRAALTEDEFLGYCKGNRIKYSLRGGKKDNESEKKDASKARKYIDFQLEEV